MSSTIKIKDLADTLTDYVANGSFASIRQNVHYQSNGYARLIRLVDYNKDFSENESVWVDEHGYNFLKKSRLYGGEIIISNVGEYAGKAFICPKLDYPMTLAPNSIMLRTKENNLFYYYYFISETGYNQIRTIVNSSGQPKFNKTNFKELEVPHPPLAIQNKIAGILSVIDNKLLANNKIIETSEKLMREIYDYWFVQFDFPDENGRSYKSSGGEMVYDEKLKREIPKGWRIFNIEDLASSVWGQCPDGINILDKDERGDDILPYCSGAGDMYGGYIVNCQATTNASRREVEKGAILISVAGTIGKMAIANERISLGRATLGLMPKDKEYSALVWLLLKSFNPRLQTASVGAVQKIINKSNLKEINIALPEKMLDINILNDTMSLIYELSIENKKLNSLRDWLLPMLMNGQIKVSD